MKAIDNRPSWEANFSESIKSESTRIKWDPNDKRKRW